MTVGSHCQCHDQTGKDLTGLLCGLFPYQTQCLDGTSRSFPWELLAEMKGV